MLRWTHEATGVSPNKYLNPVRQREKERKEEGRE
jgi:hypothetical protein